MNQNEKDAFDKWYPNHPSRWSQDFEYEDCVHAFLAGIQYERNRQSEVVRMSFDEWYSQRAIFRSVIKNGEIWEAAYAQGMKDAKDGM